MSAVLHPDQPNPVSQSRFVGVDHPNLTERFCRTCGDHLLSYFLRPDGSRRVVPTKPVAWGSYDLARDDYECRDCTMGDFG